MTQHRVLTLNMNAQPLTDAERRQRIRRNVFWLALLALGFYFGFILLAVSRA